MESFAWSHCKISLEDHCRGSGQAVLRLRQPRDVASDPIDGALKEKAGSSSHLAWI